MTLKLCISGASGDVGRALVRAVLASDDLTLACAVGRSAAGLDAGTVAGTTACGVTLSATLDEAMATPFDVLVDYTHPDIIKAGTLAAIARGIHVVIGTSGLTAADFEDIDTAARKAGVGVVTSNFSLTAALLQHFALIAARYVPQWEVVEYAKAEKPDAPSGTARELAERLSEVAAPRAGQDISALRGPRESRGAVFGTTRVHSLRLPGYEHTVETIFGMPGERLVLRHEAMLADEPYVAGTLLAARKAPSVKGLVRGLDTLLFD